MSKLPSEFETHGWLRTVWMVMHAWYMVAYALLVTGKEIWAIGAFLIGFFLAISHRARP